MSRFLAQTALLLLANALALVVASLLLAGFSINGLAFAVAVCIFTASTVILEPLIAKIAARKRAVLAGWYRPCDNVRRFACNHACNGWPSIIGMGTWVVATLIIWLATIVASLVLPLFLFKEVLSKGQQGKGVAYLRRPPRRSRKRAAGFAALIGQRSIRWIDHDVLRSLRGIPRATALLVDHAAVVHRHAACGHGVHHRADDGGGHGNGRADRRRPSPPGDSRCPSRCCSNRRCRH